MRSLYFGEIEVVHNAWEGYLSGRVPRSRIAHAMGIVNAKYIISIVHQFQRLM